jgi:Gpi18-like mannosyltransferase
MTSQQGNLSFSKKLLIILVSSFVLKIILAYTCDTADTGAFNLATKLFLQGKDVYSHPDVNLSPPPLFLHLLSLLRVGSTAAHLPFEGSWKLPSILSDTGIAAFIFFVSVHIHRLTERKALRLTALYAFNPISLFVSGFHGQAESTWILFILLAWYFASVRKSFFWSAVCAAFALSYKLPALLLLPGLYLTLPKSRRDWVLYTLTVVSFFSASLLPEIVTSRTALIRQVFAYSSTPNVWGFTLIMSKLFHPEVSSALVSIVGRVLKLCIASVSMFMLLRYLARKSTDFFSLSLSILVVFLFFSPGFGSQYMLWPLPFLLLTHHRQFWKYTIFTTFAFLNTYGIPLPIFIVPIQFLQYHLFYKMYFLYPYDLYIPVWILLGKVLWNDLRYQNKSHPTKKQTIPSSL